MMSPHMASSQVESAPPGIHVPPAPSRLTANKYSVFPVDERLLAAPAGPAGFEPAGLTVLSRRRTAGASPAPGPPHITDHPAVHRRHRLDRHVIHAANAFDVDILQAAMESRPWPHRHAGSGDVEIDRAAHIARHRAAR